MKSTYYPYNPEDQRIQSDVKRIKPSRAFVALITILEALATVADVDGILGVVTDDGSEQEIITGITNPGTARNITATAAGTSADIGAIAVIIEGTNMADEVITETLAAFTVNTAGIVTGSKAFKTVTKVTIPAHDGTGATTKIGFGEALGMPYKLPRNTVLAAYKDNALETTAPTVTVSATALENNTIDLNSVLNSKQVDVYLLV